MLAGAYDCQAGSVSKGQTSPTLRGQILSSWSSSQCPPQTPPQFSSFLCSSCLSSSLWFSSSFLLLHPGPGERSCWRVFRDQSCAPTGRRLRRVNTEMDRLFAWQMHFWVQQITVPPKIHKLNDECNKNKSSAKHIWSQQLPVEMVKIKPLSCLCLRCVVGKWEYFTGVWHERRVNAPCTLLWWRKSQINNKSLENQNHIEADI